MRSTVDVRGISLGPATLFDALSGNSPLKGLLREHIEVIGAPGESLASPLESRDVLVIRALGEGRLGWFRPATEGHPMTDALGRVLPDRMVVRLPEDNPPAAPVAPPPAPDTAVANAYVQAHSSRFCTPGAPGACRRIPNPRPIRQVVIHVLAVPSTSRRTGAQSVVLALQRAGRAASPHYVIDRDGTITQTVRENDVAFHVPGGNTDSIGIEHADICNDPAPFTTTLYERSAELVRDIARRHAFTLDRTTVRGHVEISPNHGDPGAFWDWEYYLRLLAWDGRTASTRPIRVVTRAADQSSVPTGWHAQNRRAIPNSHCAGRRDPYGPQYWTASKSATDPPAELPIELPVAGRYEISAWWPRVSAANTTAPVSVLVGGTATASATLDQSRDYGKWNAIGTIHVTTAPTIATVRFERNSGVRGTLICDSVRALSV